jgi:hypothetical protein
MIGRRSATPSGVFRITHKSGSRFSLAEILLMASINHIESKRKAGHK